MSESANQSPVFVGEAAAPGEGEPGGGLQGQLPDPLGRDRGVRGRLPDPLLRCQEESCVGITTITKILSTLSICVCITKFFAALTFNQLDL